MSNNYEAVLRKYNLEDNPNAQEALKEVALAVFADIEKKKHTMLGNGFCVVFWRDIEWLKKEW
jgi:hypothetical protein